MAISDSLKQNPNKEPYKPKRYFCWIFHPKEWHLNFNHFKDGPITNCQLGLGIITFEFGV